MRHVTRGGEGGKEGECDACRPFQMKFMSKLFDRLSTNIFATDADRLPGPFPKSMHSVRNLAKQCHPRPNGNYVCLSAEDAVSQWSPGGNNHNMHKIVNSLFVCKISRGNVNGTMELIIMGNDEHVNK